MGLTAILILAVVQGIAEFLPVSSSGHVVILAALLAPEQADSLHVADVNIVLHLGTLLSIVVFYWTRIWRLLGEDRKVAPLLLVGTIPAIAVGLPLKFFAEHMLESPLLAGCLLPVTGGLLLWAARLPRGEKQYRDLNYSEAFLIGIWQAFAILPGISRSGSTIACGLLRNLTRKSAATYSFLLALPAIAGAGLLEIIQTSTSAESLTVGLFPLLAGAAVSFGVGLFSLWWVVRWLEQGRIHYFAAWCIPFGIAVVVWQLLIV